MLEACYDPHQNMKFYRNRLAPHQVIAFLFNELSYSVQRVLLA